MIGIEDVAAIVGQPMFILYPEDIQQRLRSEIIPAVLSEDQWLGELRMSVNGRVIPTLENYYTLRDENGQPTMFVAMISDISERKAAEVALQEAQARAQTTLEAINVPLLISGVGDGKIHYANQPLAELVDVPLQVLLEKGTPDFYVNTDDRAAVVGQIQEQGYATNYELRLKQANGTQFWALLSAQLFTFDDEPAILTTVLDITDRKAAEDAQQAMAQNLSERLEEMNALQRAMARDGWDSFLANENRAGQGYSFSGVDIKPVTSGELSKQIGAAPIDFNQLTEPSISPEQQAMAIPLNLYGESIGVFGARSESGEPLTEEQQSLLAELSTQVTEALERARLFEETEIARTQTESLYASSSQIVRATTIDKALDALVQSSKLSQFSRTAFLSFDKPWTDVQPEKLTMNVIHQKADIPHISDLAEEYFLDAPSIYAIPKAG